MNFCAHFSHHSILFNFFSFNYFFFRIQRWFCFCYVQCAYNFICVVYSTYLLVSDVPTTSKCSMNMNNGIFIPWSSAYFSTNTNLFLITTNSKHTHIKRKKLHDTKWQLCVHSCHRGNIKPGEKTPEVRKKMSELKEREKKLWQFNLIWINNKIKSKRQILSNWKFSSFFFVRWKFCVLEEIRGEKYASTSYEYGLTN